MIVISTDGLDIKCWCKDLEVAALEQAKNLAVHPVVRKWVALMADSHSGYGMPIGGVVLCEDAVIPYGVGVDIHCGMMAIRTDVQETEMTKIVVRQILKLVIQRVPMGEGKCHKIEQEWNGFQDFEKRRNPKPGWFQERTWILAKKNLGTLGGGNHFLEILVSEDGVVWLMIHTGSRNLGYVICNYYHRKAIKLMEKQGIELPDRNLSYLPVDSDSGANYIIDMDFAGRYAQESRKRIARRFCESFKEVFPNATFPNTIHIDHNFAAREAHFGKDYWVHRKGATFATKHNYGIIPGSMSTPSYIVRGKGNKESFNTCSHGGGRAMSRADAIRLFNVEECDRILREKGIVYPRWRKIRKKDRKSKKFIGRYDLSEFEHAYKDIETVMESQGDLVEVVTKLFPLGVEIG